MDADAVAQSTAVVAAVLCDHQGDADIAGEPSVAVACALDNRGRAERGVGFGVAG